MKRLVADALETSIIKQTHRGRREDQGDIDYIWSRMMTREKTFYYQINRNSELLKLVKEHMSSEARLTWIFS